MCRSSLRTPGGPDRPQARQTDLKNSLKVPGALPFAPYNALWCTGPGIPRQRRRAEGSDKRSTNRLYVLLERRPITSK